eukprot:scaffold242842_cov36-Cyclotella_meneghiniana.AAC.1
MEPTHPYHKSQIVATIVVNEFQSQPCLIIHHTHTHNETLGQSSCCEKGALIQNHTVLVLKVGDANLKF